MRKIAAVATTMASTTATMRYTRLAVSVPDRPACRNTIHTSTELLMWIPRHTFFDIRFINHEVTNECKLSIPAG